MGQAAKTLLRATAVVALLLAIDSASILLVHESLRLHLSLYSFVEGAALMVAAGLLDLGDSALGTAVRRGLFRTGEKWSYDKYESHSNIKPTLLYAGITLFSISFLILI